MPRHDDSVLDEDGEPIEEDGEPIEGETDDPSDFGVLDGIRRGCRIIPRDPSQPTGVITSVTRDVCIVVFPDRRYLPRDARMERLLEASGNHPYVEPSAIKQVIAPRKVTRTKLDELADLLESEIAEAAAREKSRRRRQRPVARKQGRA